MVDGYNLDAILAVGYRVRSLRGTQFRRWATERLGEYLVNGFTLDDERLKNPGPGAPDYFDELIERIRDIRTGEDNADAHMKRQIMGREVVVAITKGQLDFGPWEQIFYGEFDGNRHKRVLVKIIGE